MSHRTHDDGDERLTLPDFLIVGAMRSGTTGLASALGQHPEVFMTPKKELHFFDLNIGNGVGWYRSHFADAEGRAAGEASPSYMFDADGVRRMSALLPSAKLIAILRDPVDRAYSHYWHSRERGRETLAFEDALETEASRMRSADVLDRLYFSYFSRGLYHRQLEYLGRFFSRDQLLVLLLEEFRDEQPRTLQRVWRFLDVTEGFLPGQRRLNRNSYRAARWPGLTGILQPRKDERPAVAAAKRLLAPVATKPVRYPPMSSITRRSLLDRYAEPNEALAGWLGRSLAPWEGSTTSRSATSRSFPDEVPS
jgi:hypothetical protein